jgi:hypothetical protein
MKDIEFKANGYLEKTYLDKDGAKHVTLEFSVKDAVELAKLELMGRDLKSHLPILLEVRVKQSRGKFENRPSVKIYR